MFHFHNKSLSFYLSNNYFIDAFIILTNSPDFSNLRNPLSKILINSSQQCGRSTLMKLEICESLEVFLKQYPQTKILDFSEHTLESTTSVDTILIGTEGGFSHEERVLFNKENVLGLHSNLILRSETAAISVASKILL